MSITQMSWFCVFFFCIFIVFLFTAEKYGRVAAGDFEKDIFQTMPQGSGQVHQVVDETRPASHDIHEMPLLHTRHEMEKVLR